VKHGVHTRHGFSDARKIPDITFNQADLNALEILAFARGEVVQHDDLIAARNEKTAQVRPDEPTAAGHQAFHGRYGWMHVESPETKGLARKATGLL
jgi:hypothetical protein